MNKKLLINFLSLVCLAIYGIAIAIVGVNKWVMALALIVWTLFAYHRGREDAEDKWFVKYENLDEEWIQKYEKLIELCEDGQAAHQKTLEDYRKEICSHCEDISEYKSLLEQLGGNDESQL